MSKLIFLEIIREIENQLNENPNYADLHYHLALFQTYNGNFTVAKKEIEQSLLINSKYTQPIELKKAIQSFKEQNIAKPDKYKPLPACFSDMYNLVAVYYAQKGDMALAENALRESFAINHDEADYNLHFGLLEEAKGELDSAIIHLKKAIEINPQSWKPYFILSQIYALQDRMQEASDILQKSVQIFPPYADLHYHLGLLLAGTDKLNEAVLHLEKAIEINPSFIFAQYHLGNVYLQSGNHQRAEEQFAKTIELGFREASTFMDLGRVQLLNEKYPEAEKSAQLALQLDTVYPEAYMLLGDIYEKWGKHELCLQARKNAVELTEKGAP